MIVLPVRVQPEDGTGDRTQPFPAWLSAVPDAIELSTGARSTAIPNGCLERASVTRALIDPRLNISLNAPIYMYRYGEVTRLRLHTKPWYRRELQRYADEINERVYDRGRFKP